MCFGTPQYMAPELIQGKPFDKSVDLYALSVIAFEMIAGFLPWDGGDPREVLLSVVKNPAPRIEQMHASIKNPIAVDTFLQRALSKDRALRRPDAVGFFREFEAALFGNEKPPRVASSLPREDAVFATVWAASLDLCTETPVEERTQIDGGPRFDAPAETTGTGQGPSGFGGGPTKSGVRRKRLMSGWMRGLSFGEITSPDPHTDLADTLPAGAMAVAAVPPATVKPLVSPAPARLPAAKPKLISTRTEATEMITGPVPRPVYLWLVPLLLGLVTFAAALGYFLGRQAQ
jgi:serine/threonine protein kinase